MYFLNNSLVQHARDIYKNLSVSGNEIQSGNKLFQLFGPGNVLGNKDRASERFNDYENLLIIFNDDDPIKYKKIHKGTPFFFLSWLAFDLRNFEKALFYLDAAISEDIKNIPSSWKTSPPYAFLTLESNNDHVAIRVAQEIRELISEQINRFNLHNSDDRFQLINFIDKFVNVLIADFPKRSIITAFYTFILEFKDRHQDLSLRSDGGGSIEPFLTHLFKGGLIFESLLKHLYPFTNSGKPVETLGKIFNETSFNTDFSVSISTRSSSLKSIIEGISANDIQTAFNTTSKLRNTTGHNLVWDNIFDDPNKYKILFEQQINALFFVISKKFL